uniref:Olfactomedin-like 2Ba n=1 Tax=Gasterosteus aculeatus TaxID=69293 RepID=G3PD48_GASAC
MKAPRGRKKKSQRRETPSPLRGWNVLKPLVLPLRLLMFHLQRLMTMLLIIVEIRLWDVWGGEQLLGDYDKVKALSEGSDCRCKCVVRPLSRSACRRIEEGSAAAHDFYTVETITSGPECKCACIAPPSAVNPCEGEFRLKRLREAGKENVKLSTVLELLEGSFYGMDLLKLHSITNKLLDRMDNMEKVHSKSLSEKQRMQMFCLLQTVGSRKHYRGQIIRLVSYKQKMCAATLPQRKAPRLNQTLRTRAPGSAQRVTAGNRPMSAMTELTTSLSIAGEETTNAAIEATRVSEDAATEEVAPTPTTESSTQGAKQRVQITGGSSAAVLSSSHAPNAAAGALTTIPPPTTSITAHGAVTTAPMQPTAASTPAAGTRAAAATPREKTKSAFFSTSAILPPSTRRPVALSPLTSVPVTTPGTTRPSGRRNLPQENQVRECKDTLATISEPVTHNAYGRNEGAWMKDPKSDNDKIYVTNFLYGNNLLEFRNLQVFKQGRFTNSYKLPYNWIGTGHVVYGGAFFYNRALSRDIIKFDLRLRYVAAWTMLHDALVDEATSPWEWRRHSEVDFAVDESGLWIIYPALDDEGFLQEVIVLSRLDPSDLSTQRETTWRTGLRRNHYGNCFIVCGVLYAVDSFNQRDAKLEYAFDTHTNTQMTPRMPFTNNYTYTTQVDYNPKEGVLYAWDNGHQVTYDIKFAY